MAGVTEKEKVVSLATFRTDFAYSAICVKCRAVTKVFGRSTARPPSCPHCGGKTTVRK